MAALQVRYRNVPAGAAHGFSEPRRGELPCDSLRRNAHGHRCEELRAAFVAIGRHAISHADVARGVPVVTSAVTLQVWSIRAS
jgi:hypothetical protein